MQGLRRAFHLREVFPHKAAAARRPIGKHKESRCPALRHDELLSRIFLILRLMSVVQAFSAPIVPGCLALHFVGFGELRKKLQHPTLASLLQGISLRSETRGRTCRFLRARPKGFVSHGTSCCCCSLSISILSMSCD